MKKSLFATLVFAFVIRLISLNQSLWLDEATTAIVAKTYSYVGIVKYFSPSDFHPPLYYLFMKWWTGLFGFSEISLRLPSVIASVLTGWTLYKIVKNNRSIKRYALWVASLYLFNPLIVYYSQEARMYAIVTLFTTLVFYYLEKIYKITSFKKKDVLSVCLCNLFIFLSLTTFYGSIFFIFSIYIYLILKKRLRILVFTLPGTVTALILSFPLLNKQLIHSYEILKLIPDWSEVLGKSNFKNVLLIPIKFSIGHISWEPKIIYHVVAGVWTGFVIVCLSRSFFKLDWRRKNSQLFYSFIFVIPLLLGFTVSFYKPLLQYFRFLYVIPFMSILLAVGSTKMQKSLLLLGFIGFSLLYVLNPYFHREDWRSLLIAIPAKSYVYGTKSIQDPIKYYRSDIEIKDMNTLTASISQVMIIPYTTAIYGIDYSTRLRKIDKKLSNSYIYRGLSLEIWK